MWKTVLGRKEKWKFERLKLREVEWLVHLLNLTKSGNESAGNVYKQRLPDYIPVKMSLNVILSTVDSQCSSWLMRYTGTHFHQITAPKSANKP